jgi:hypothetical protein
MEEEIFWVCMKSERGEYKTFFLMLNKDFSFSKYMFFQEQYLDSFFKNIS